MINALKQKIFLFGLMALLFGKTAIAQNELAVGLSYGSDIEEVGILLDGNFYVSPEFSLSPSFTIFFADEPFDFYTIDFDARYNFNLGSGTYVYPLGGLNFSIFSFDRGFRDDDSDTELGMNLGGGINHFFNSNVGILGELKAILGDADQIMLSFGVVFRL